MVQLGITNNTNKKIVINVDVILALLLVIVVFFFGHASNHGDNALFSSGTLFLLRNFILVVLVLSYFLIIAFNKISFSIIIIVPIIYLLLFTLNVYQDSSSSFDVIQFLKMLPIFLVTSKIRKKVLNYYRYLLIAMAFFGILAFALHYITPSSFCRVVDYYGRSGGAYLDYGYAFLYQDNSFLVRLCGLFNEPGYFGTISALILCWQKFNFKKLGNTIIFIAGIMTFSVAFFVIIFIYLAVISFKKPALFISMILAVAFFLFALPNIDFGNAIINSFVSRIYFIDGSIAGDNRSNQFIDAALKGALASNPLFGYGVGYSSFAFSAYSISTYKTYIIDNGLVGFFLLYGSIAFSLFKRFKFDICSIAFLLSFFASVYQRPGIFNPLYMLIVFAGMEELGHFKEKHLRSTYSFKNNESLISKAQ